MTFLKKYKMDYDYDGYENELLPQDEFYHDEDEDEYEDIDYSGMSFDQIITSCVLPTFYQTVNSLSHVILLNVTFRLSTQLIDAPRFLQHLASIICGIFVLYSLFPASFFLLLIFCVLSYVPLRVPAYRGRCLLLLSAALLVFYEFTLEPKAWHRVRGPHMILIMKAISLGFDLDIGTVKDPPSLLKYCGYLLCPGTCVFGPWTSFLEYLNIYEQPKWRLIWLRRIAVNTVLSLVFLMVSTCFVHYVFPDTKWRWIAAYRDALAFRCSHYFVCYLSETTLLLSGHTKSLQDDDMAVSKPWNVEIPRSLIQVVVSWNIPMHTWLKIYVFNTSRRLGNFLAVIATYGVSALLHGLNFQLAAVLLSLGLYSYVEFMLRKKLASIFNACIQARPCKPECSHSSRWNHPAVLAVNISLTFVAMIHLAYLGVMFDTSESSESGYSYQHTLNKWSQLNYFSHYLALFSYIMYFLI